MSWSKSFKVKQATTDSSYNQKVAGESRMGAGKHDGVTLAAVTPVDSTDYHAYDLIWENAIGETMKERMFITNAIKDDSGRLTGEREISDNFIKLGLALSGGDNILNQQFFLEEENGAYINPERMKAAIGTKTTLVIGLPKTGYTVRNTESGSVIVDIETGIPFDSQVFPEFGELKAFAEKTGIKLAYNRVKFYRVFKDSAESNRTQLAAAMDATKPVLKAKKVQGF